MPTLTGYTPHASWPNCCFPTGGGESPADLYRLRSTQHRAHRRGLRRPAAVTTTPPALLPAGPDSSRESNRRLAQITQYARQLAGSPSVINALRSQLDEVGLTSRDIILFNQIIGFVGFRARAIAVLQAARAFRCAGSPVCPSKRRHPRAVRPPPGAWQADIADPDLQYADDERQRRIAGWQSLPGLGELAPLLACDPQLFAPLETLIRQLSTDDTFGPQVALLTARTNGSPPALTPAPHWQGEGSSPAICGRATSPPSLAPAASSGPVSRDRGAAVNPLA